MRYYLGCTLKPEVIELHRSLVERISKRFGESMVKQERTPHITLKSPFGSNSPEEIKSFLERFLKFCLPLTKNLNFSINELGFFPGKAVYLSVCPSQRLVCFHRRLLDSIYFERDEYDTPEKKHHITLVGKEAREKLSDIYDFVCGTRINLESCVDNLTLFRKSDGLTYVEESYSL